ncbi:alkene reductase [Aspergillus lucknowensis]|uniref:NADH:flavin oxidoreductase/NADH oxidase N-terminal domain-containing protein n=1 Tax=Aspergillus lucknowensis TaxID=176173 RepID=A0ABR4LH44_9EURO
MPTSKLFTPLKVGSIEVAHRLALAPMTRFRNDDRHVPLDMVIQYYEQRASVPGTLLITEATLISQRAGVYKNVPGIWSPEQIAQWRKVTDAVHAKGSYIYSQLWALGRVADIEATRGEVGRPDAELIAPTAEAFSPGVVPREMSEDDIRGVIGDFATAARNAVAAGFDGVEIHGANGYLIDQFIQNVTNKRNDRWGGSVENRARFPVEVIRAVVDAIGAERTAIRYSPWSTYQGMGKDSDAELIEQFGEVARQTAEFGLAYVHLVQGTVSGNADVDAHPERDLDFFFRAYGHAGPVAVAGGYLGESARNAVDVHYKGYDVLVAIGRPWTANPDLPFRVKQGIPMRKYEREHFYTALSARGYIDYEFSEEFKTATAAA